MTASCHRLEGGPSDVACQEAGSSSPVMEVPNINEEYNDGMPERVPSFAVRFAHILRLAVKNETDELYCSWSIC